QDVDDLSRLQSGLAGQDQRIDHVNGRDRRLLDGAEPSDGAGRDVLDAVDDVGRLVDRPDGLRGRRLRPRKADLTDHGLDKRSLPAVPHPVLPGPAALRMAQRLLAPISPAGHYTSR